jgi:hypothetical protein
MRKSVKLVLTALTAALVLSSTVTAASARSLSTSEQSFRATWSSLEFIVRGVTTIRCRVTLEGSFHTRTIAKVARSLIGAISRAIVAHPCTNGEGWADNGTENTPGGRTNRLPFHVTYESFVAPTGLPNITGINLLLSRISFVIQSGGLCTGRYGRAEDNITGLVTVTGGRVSTLAPVEGRNRASLVTRIGGIFCPETGDFSGVGSVANLSTGAALTVTLI